MSLTYTLTKSNDTSNISVLIDGELYQADSTHPCFDQITQGALVDDESIAALFDIAQAAVGKLSPISDRFSTANGRLYLDGDEIDNSLSRHIVRTLQQGSGFEPLVKYYEHLLANPNEHSCEHLYRWQKAHDFTITPDGLIVGYKGVSKGSDGKLWSTTRGHAFADGVEYHQDRIPNEIDTVVSMPRSEVAFDPSRGCSSGLHVGTYEFASGYGDTVLEVHINPRDVVSVPTDSGDAKMRVCRYTVVQTLEKAYEEAVTAPYDHEVEVAKKRVRYPSEADFAQMQRRAKRRRRNFTKYALKHTTWSLIEGRDGKDRKDWTL